MDPLLDLVHLHKQFDGVKAVDDVSLAVMPGQLTTIIGPNGAGKTTLFNLITGVVRPDGGEVIFKGRRMNGLPLHRIALAGLGRTFQDPRIFRYLDVLGNVLVGFKEQADEAVTRALVRGHEVRAQEQRRAVRARELLGLTGVQDPETRLARDLTFGAERLLSVARTLAGEPELLLLDEPSVGLDHEGVEVLCGLLRRLVREFRRTVLLVEHNMDVVMRVSDVIVVMQEGRIVSEGTPEAIRRDAGLVRAYLGEAYVA